MVLGESYMPADHVLTFKKTAVKNRKTIEFELPRQGELAWVRDLVDLYLYEARPILLDGVASQHFFVGNQRIPNAKPWLVRQAFNEILSKLSKQHLSDLLPPELGALNPHLLRHITATYQISVRGDRDMAARLLNDTVQTIEKHYADLLASSRRDCREFFEDFDPN
jgi:site-specific recombinase XerD